MLIYVGNFTALAHTHAHTYARNHTYTNTQYSRPILKDEQEMDEALKENNMKWDVIGLGEVRRKEESFRTVQSGHLLYHSVAHNGQAGVGFLVNKKWKDNITRGIPEHLGNIQRYTPITLHPTAPLYNNNHNI